MQPGDRSPRRGPLGGQLLLGTAVAYAGGNGDFSDLMLVACGGALAGWLIWTGRMGGTGRATPDHAATPVR